MKLSKNIQKTLLINVFIMLSMVINFSYTQLAKNQLTAYPQTYEPAVSQLALKSSNFTAPLMSRSLFERDPKRKLRKTDFLEIFRYGLYQLTRGETEQIFNFADLNHDDMIDSDEWNAFTTLYILPFEACDVNKSYIIDPKEFGVCFDKDPKSTVVTFRRRYQEKRHEMLMEVVSTRGKSIVNFSDYVFLRRALFGWLNCHSSNKYIAMSQFKCAMKQAIPQKYHLKFHYEKVYKVGLSLANDRNLIQLDFITYLRALHYSYVFGVLGLPHDTPVLEKSQFVKAIREDRLPLNWSEEEINIIFDLIDATPFKINKYMNFDAWSFFYNLHRIFFKYNEEKPLQISKMEMLQALKDQYFPKEFLMAIDSSKALFSESQYMEVSVILQRLRLNEKDFYFSFKQAQEQNMKELSVKDLRFKQDASLTTHSFWNITTVNSTFWDINANETNREIFFSTMTSNDKKFWNLEIYYRAMVLTNFFTTLHGDDDKIWLIGAPKFVDETSKLYETVVPPFGMKLRKNYNFYKNLPREIQIDILSFLAIENYFFKINSHKNDSNNLINESILKIILKDYGMINMPDQVLDLSQKNYDPLRRRVYEIHETLKNIIIVHTAAGDNVRSLDRLTTYGLKANTDPGRAFNDHSRRFLSSPLA
jgi:hypothetical protein